MCFEDFYVIEPNSGCWLWIGAVSGGYGRKQHDGKVQQAHRVSYQLHVGPVPAGKVLDHKCRTKLCVNPDHLEPVTQSENIKRGALPRLLAARQQVKTHCPQGHPLDGIRKGVVRNGVRGNSLRYCKTCNRLREAEKRKGNQSLVF